MPVRAYGPRSTQLSFSWFQPNHRTGLLLTRDKLRLLDGELCDSATRTTRGRLHSYIKEDEMRTPFERDILRISSSELFYRLQDKTQVIPQPYDPSVINRFSHSLEVARLSRNVAGILRLNPDLAEAIGLAHDLGHAPFGHAGESVLNELRFKHLGLYHKHNIQGLRLIDDLYRQSSIQEPLDPTFEVRDGVICHLGAFDEPAIIPYGGKTEEPRKEFSLSQLKIGNIPWLDESVRIFYPSTLEGCVVRYMDHISSVARDPQDAIKRGVLSWSDLPESTHKLLRNEYGLSGSSIIKALIASLLENSWDSVHHNVYAIKMGDQEREAMRELHDFNKRRIYREQELQEVFVDKAREILGQLFDYLTNSSVNQEQGPLGPQEVIDHISSLTDAEALQRISQITGQIYSFASLSSRPPRPKY